MFTKLLSRFCFALLLVAMQLDAAPFVPQDDAQVLETLRDRTSNPVFREVRELRARLRAQPQNLSLALRLARRYIELSRGEADPRYLGYAQAALAPWWTSPSPPAPVLVMRATIRQSNHDFAAALADLAQALRQEPNNAQAWLTRATILQVRGEYEAAEQNCEHLRGSVSELVLATCLTTIATLRGDAERAYEQLAGALALASGASDETIWALTALAEMAARLNQPHLAARHFAQALESGVPDSYLKGAYADFLLDQGDAQKVVALLRNETRADPLLLRLAIAERALGMPEAASHIAALDARFAASRMRGDTVHRREEARFALHLMTNANAALELAQANWQVQREPADARIFLEAALAAKQPRAAKPILDWLAASKLEDTRIVDLVQKLSELTT